MYKQIIFFLLVGIQFLLFGAKKIEIKSLYNLAIDAVVKNTRLKKQALETIKKTPIPIKENIFCELAKKELERKNIFPLLKLKKRISSSTQIEEIFSKNAPSKDHSFIDALSNKLRKINRLIICKINWNKITFCGCSDGTILIENCENKIHEIKAHNDVICDLIIKDRYLYSLSWDQTVAVWNIMDTIVLSQAQCILDFFIFINETKKREKEYKELPEILSRRLDSTIRPTVLPESLIKFLNLNFLLKYKLPQKRKFADLK